MTDSVTVFRHADFAGEQLAVTGDIESLRSPFDRNVSSAQVNAPVAMFTEPRFRGEAVVLTENTPRFSNIRGRNLNDVIRSIRVEPIRIRLNVTIGVDGSSTPSKPVDEVAEHVAMCNELFGEWGIEFEAGELRVVGDLAVPMTATNQDQLIAPYLRDDAVNILYFNGTQWQPEAWKWRAKSFQVEATTPGGAVPTAELFSDPNYNGTKTAIGGDVATTINLAGTESVRVADGGVVTMFGAGNQAGPQLDLFDDEPNLNDRRVIANWWGGGLIGHCCHGTGRLIRMNQQSGRLTMAHELGHYLGLIHTPGDRSNLMFPTSNGGRTVTAEQAEVVWAAVMKSDRLRRLLA